MTSFVQLNDDPEVPSVFRKSDVLMLVDDAKFLIANCSNISEHHKTAWRLQVSERER